MNGALTGIEALRQRGREGGVTSGHCRRDKILERVATLPIDARVLEAYKQGYQAGYHAAKKRCRPRH